MATEGKPITKDCGCIISFNECGLYLIAACDMHKQIAQSK